MDERRIKILVNWIGTYAHDVPCSNNITTVIATINKNKNFDKKLISRSNIPTFVLGVLAPKAILV